MQPSEGVIKYQLHHEDAHALGPLLLTRLIHWFHRCHAAGLIGQDPDRYDGYAYGNISCRWPDRIEGDDHVNHADDPHASGDAFAISGTQTGMLSHIGPDQIALVTRVMEEQNRVFSKGPVQPSSEAMSHAMIYRARPEVQAVIHVHSPEIWRHAGELGLAITDPSAAYGSPEMTQEVLRLLDAPSVIATGVFSMGGHLDGIIAFAESMDLAGQRLVDLQQQAGRL